MKHETKTFKLVLRKKNSPQDNFTKHKKVTKPDNYTQKKKLLYDSTDEKKYLIHYRIIKFYDRHGVNIDKIL